MSKFIKSVGVPIMYYVLVDTDEEDDDLVVASVREMLLDVTEENWYDEFEYGGSTLSFESIEWLDGAYVHLVEETDEITEATEDGVSETGGELRSPVGDVQAARERDEGLPM